jgi:hypothetical protein
MELSSLSPRPRSSSCKTGEETPSCCRYLCLREREKERERERERDREREREREKEKTARRGFIFLSSDF